MTSQTLPSARRTPPPSAAAPQHTASALAPMAAPIDDPAALKGLRATGIANLLRGWSGDADLDAYQFIPPEIAWSADRTRALHAAQLNVARLYQRFADETRRAAEGHFAAILPIQREGLARALQAEMTIVAIMRSLDERRSDLSRRTDAMLARLGDVVLAYAVPVTPPSSKPASSAQAGGRR